MVEHNAQKYNVHIKEPEVSFHEAALYKQIYGDRNRFLQVIVNFLTNSIKFSQNKDKPEIHLHLDLIETHKILGTDFDTKEGFVKTKIPHEETKDGKGEPASIGSLESKKKIAYMEFKLSI